MGEPLLTVNLEQTPEGVFVYCPELDIYTAGANQAEAERKFVSLLFEYYDTLDHNRDSLDEIMRSHLDLYEQRLFPEMLRAIGGYSRFVQELRRSVQAEEKGGSRWERVTSSNLVKFCPA